MNDIELRSAVDAVEVRSDNGKLVLSGTAIRYGARSKNLGGFRERIMPGAVTEQIQKGDVYAFEEHRSERYLGRLANTTLRLFDTATELRYEVDLPDTAVGREVATLAERRDYKGSSFGFRAHVASVKWSKDDDGTALRSIHSFALLRDVGPTIAPAYEQTTAEVALRHFPQETGLDIEVRSVLEAAKTGGLAQLLDGVIPTSEGNEEETEPVIHRRPVHWFA